MFKKGVIPGQKPLEIYSKKLFQGSALISKDLSKHNNFSISGISIVPWGIHIHLIALIRNELQNMLNSLFYTALFNVIKLESPREFPTKMPLPFRHAMPQPLSTQCAQCGLLIDFWTVEFCVGGEKMSLWYRYISTDLNEKTLFAF